MSVVNDKYRGTPKYFHVLAELVRAAQYRGLTTYQDIALLMGLPPSGSHMGKEAPDEGPRCTCLTARAAIVWSWTRTYPESRSLG